MRSSIKAMVFDMGGTLMRVFSEYTGPMAYWPRVEPVPGVAQALEQLSKDLVCCVASNAGFSDSELLGKALARGNIRHYFKHVFTSRVLGVEKPDPRFFYNVLERLDVAPEECIMVGDEYLKDITGAKSVGMQTIWFSQSPVTRPTPSADAIIGSMGELVPAVTKLIDAQRASIS